MNLRSIAICSATVLLSLGNARGHVPHDIIYSLDVSPTFASDGLVFSSSTQFGAAHLRSSNYGETFSESHAGMQRTLVTGHTFSPNFDRDGTIFMATQAGYYKSTDRGRNWKRQSRFADEEVLSICAAEDYTEAGSTSAERISRSRSVMSFRSSGDAMLFIEHLRRPELIRYCRASGQQVAGDGPSLISSVPRWSSRILRLCSQSL